MEYRRAVWQGLQKAVKGIIQIQTTSNQIIPFTFLQSRASKSTECNIIIFKAT